MVQCNKVHRNKGMPIKFSGAPRAKAEQSHQFMSHMTTTEDHRSTHDT